MNISQQKLAYELNVSRNKIASYEGKGIEPSLSLLLKMATYFQISVEDLLRTKLDEETLSAAKEAYLEGSRLAGPHIQGHTRTPEIKLTSTNGFSEFIDQSKQAQQMLEGFKVFYKLKSSSAPLKEETKNLILILENIVESNNTFIDRITT